MPIGDGWSQRVEAVLERLDKLADGRASLVGAGVGVGVMGAALWAGGPAPWIAGAGVGAVGARLMLTGAARVVGPPRVVAEPAVEEEPPVVEADWLPGWWGPAPRPVRIGEVPPPEVLRAAERPVMVWIPGGEFWMGSRDDEADAIDEERPRFRCRVKDFAVAATPVTRRQWAAVMGEERGRGPVDGPVNEVTSFDAARYCNRLSEREGLRPVYRVWEQERAEADLSADGYRLPTEAEWEYAARAGTETRWSFGQDESELEYYAWYKKNGGSITHTVAERRANPWGLFDVHGNVWEWCENRRSPYKAAPGVVDDPFMSNVVDTVVNNVPRALRGGSAWLTPRSLRSAFRSEFGPRLSYLSLGFRCVRAPPRQPDRSSVVP